ncbi:hypothetical protein [Pseudodesulfovibrio sp. JC047]|uniref:hypothetical protein n=1 Tax=Pseudodesulfovibrio sp. JC047 TaxID=2683199 RepID=UPI00193F9022|nr:hypothetical protein [Pseudodesulfovibrio sp. JC047]
MRRALFIITTIALLGMTTGSVWASDYEDMDICLGKKVLARALCKDPLEINYVARVRKNIYLFSVFYARQESRFVVGISNSKIRIQGKEFLTLTQTIPYEFDTTSKCAVVKFTTPECRNAPPIVCCSEKTVEEKLDEKFWDRPVPDLLEEDLRRALDVETSTEDGVSAKEAPPAQ